MTGLPENLDSLPQLLARRRMCTLRELTAGTQPAASVAECLELAASKLTGSALDLPFVLFYELEESGHSARLVARVGLAQGASASPEHIELGSDASWPLRDALALGQPHAVRAHARTRARAWGSHSCAR